MFIALTSLFMNRPVKTRVAMTGEISLRGMVLPVGGIKEKVLAALAAGIEQVILPSRNKKDVEEVPLEAQRKLQFYFIDDVNEAMKVAIQA
jgi:ATP-dependent Lon protease